MQISIYEKATGRIERVVTCSEADISGQFDSETHSAIIGAICDSQFYVLNGAPVEYPNRPSQFHEFNFSLLAWEDSRALTDIKGSKWTEVKQSREAALNAPLTTTYGIFDADSKGRTSITDSVLLMQTLAGLGTPITIDFTLADNSVVTLDTAAMVAVGLALGQRTQEVHARARVLRAQIEAATTLEELDAITWEAV